MMWCAAHDGKLTALCTTPAHLHALRAAKVPYVEHPYAYWCYLLPAPYTQAQMHIEPAAHAHPAMWIAMKKIPITHITAARMHVLLYDAHIRCVKAPILKLYTPSPSASPASTPLSPCPAPCSHLPAVSTALYGHVVPGAGRLLHAVHTASASTGRLVLLALHFYSVAPHLLA